MGVRGFRGFRGLRGVEFWGLRFRVQGLGPKGLGWGVNDLGFRI